MNTRAFRIVKAQQTDRAFDGEGARLYSGRWNSAGTPMVYTAASRALAALEMLVHFSSPLLKLHYVIIEVQFDSRWVQTIPMNDLPRVWRNNQPVLLTKQIGDQWVKEKISAVLAVPSAIIPEEFNYLLNPQHPDCTKIKISKPRDFSFDTRLVKHVRK